jgi:hypothetical protein
MIGVAGQSKPDSYRGRRDLLQRLFRIDQDVRSAEMSESGPSRHIAPRRDLGR